jgi:hypothetical protein
MMAVTTDWEGVGSGYPRALRLLSIFLMLALVAVIILVHDRRPPEIAACVL